MARHCEQFCLVTAGFFGAMSVALGAFAAHGLADPDTRELVEKAAKYQMVHGLALLVLPLLYQASMIGWRSFQVTAYAFGIGGVVFPATLYGIALTGITKLGMVAPIGGTAFIIGWVTLAWGAFWAWKKPKPPEE